MSVTVDSSEKRRTEAQQPEPSEQPNDGIGWTDALGEEGSNPPHPRTSGGFILTKAKRWTIASLENRIKGQFEQWVRANALAGVEEMMSLCRNPESSEELWDAFVTKLGAKHFTWDGKGCRAARRDGPGMQYLIYLLLLRSNPDMTEKLAQEIVEENPKGAGLAYRWASGNSSASQQGSGEDQSRATKIHPVTLDS